MRQMFPMDPYETQVNDVQTPLGFSMPTLNTRKKRDWRASLFDRFVPQGDADLADADKSRMTRQGLLQLAMGLQSSPNFGEALTKGLSGGLLSMNKSVDDMQDREIKREELISTANGGTAFSALDMQAKAAGYQPGTPGYQHFMRVRGGLESKASSAGYKFEQVPGADGKSRIQRSNPNTGEVEIYDESVGDFVPVGQSSVPANGVRLPAPTTGAGSAMMGGALENAVMSVESGGNPNAVSPAGAVGTMQTMPGTLRDPGFGVAPARDNSPAELTRVGKDYLRAMVGKYGPEGGLAAYNWGPGNWEAALSRAGGDVQKALASAPQETQRYVPEVTRRANPNLVVSRPKEAEAGAVAAAQKQAALQYDPAIEGRKEQAKIDAFLRNTGQVGDAEAAVAGKRAGAEVTSRAEAERTQEGISGLGTAEANAKQALSVIDQALKHPGKNAATGWGSYNPLNKLPGKGHDFQVLHEQIKGKAFVQAFDSLRGGGAISEKEGAAATAAIARLDTSQTPAEYDKALKELKGIINSGLMRARAKAGQAAPAASGSWGIRKKGQ